MEISLDLSISELINRPNRFIFEGMVDGQLQRWHYPVTGEIGKVDNFQGMLCLFTPATNVKGRKTQRTVEAISLNRGKDWIGINQNRINGWIESLLRQNALSAMINTKGCSICHEVRVGDSRIDIAVDNGGRYTFLEFKTHIHGLLLSSGGMDRLPDSGEQRHGNQKNPFPNTTSRMDVRKARMSQFGEKEKERKKKQGWCTGREGCQKSHITAHLSPSPPLRALPLNFGISHRHDR
jgi:hypothetical protein